MTRTVSVSLNAPPYEAERGCHMTLRYFPNAGLTRLSSNGDTKISCRAVSLVAVIDSENGLSQFPIANFAEANDKSQGNLSSRNTVP